MKRATEIAILETAFEQDAEGYLFYRAKNSPGIRVTAEEREAYLATTSFLERRKWEKAIERRSPSGEPRDGREARRRLRAAMPRRFIVLAFVFGALFVAQSLGSEMPLWQRGIWLIAGLFFAGSGLANLMARRKSQRLT